MFSNYKWNARILSVADSLLVDLCEGEGVIYYLNKYGGIYGKRSGYGV